jgi:DNA-binding NarL/FixJ family response regulator
VSHGTALFKRAFPWCIAPHWAQFEIEGQMAIRELSKPVTEGTSPPRVNLLLVEDEALVASYIRDVLEESGFIVAGVASSGPEAISLASAGAVDLALVDIKLAGPMDGIEVARLLRDRFEVRSIFLSGIYDPDTMERAKAAEPLGFLQKPFRPSQVFNALEKALSKNSG